MRSLLVCVRAGSVDWATARDYVAEYGGRDAEDRFQATRDGAHAAMVDRNRDVYVWSCFIAADPGECDALRAILAPKLSRPLSDDRDVEHEAFGSVAIEGGPVDVGRVVAVDVRGENVGRETDVGALFGRYDLAILVQTRRGASSYDGAQRFSVAVEPPASTASTRPTAGPSSSCTPRCTRSCRRLRRRR